MGEGFSGGGERHRENDERAERNPLLEAQKHLDAINLLLAKIVEQGDLSSQQKQNLRARLQDHLFALGLKSIDQLPEFSAQFHRAINDRRKNLRLPSNYPTKREFAERLNESKKKKTTNLPSVWRDLTVLEVARYAQSDWHHVEGRGGKTILDYSYELGKLMSDEVMYAMTFKSGDEIKVGENWNIENGRHRVLTLKTLGEEFIRSNRMDLWIKPQKDL